MRTGSRQRATTILVAMGSLVWVVGCGDERDQANTGGDVASTSSTGATANATDPAVILEGTGAVLEAARRQGDTEFVTAVETLFAGTDPGIRSYEVPTPAMEPTIAINERILTLPVSAGRPKRGDIVVFDPTGAARTTCDPSSTDDDPFVKRVIGLAGDTVVVEAGKREVTVNGTPFDVPAAALNPGQGQSGTQPTNTFTVPPDTVFVLGDNRPNSCDSHQWSDPFVPLPNVRERVVGVHFPPQKARVIR